MRDDKTQLFMIFDPDVLGIGNPYTIRRLKIQTVRNEKRDRRGSGNLFCCERRGGGDIKRMTLHQRACKMMPGLSIINVLLPFIAMQRDAIVHLQVYLLGARKRDDPGRVATDTSIIFQLKALSCEVAHGH